MKKLLLIIAIATAALYPAAPIMIPVTDSQVYDYLDYLNTSQVINIPFTGIKPYRSDEIYALLKEIDSPDKRTGNFIDRFEERYISQENKFGSDISNRISAWLDSETINFKFKYHFDYDRHITAGYTRENRGEPMWGKWDQPNYTTDIKTFLRGTVEKTNRYYTNLHYRYNKYLSADIYYSHTRTDNYNHNLPPYEESEAPPEKILQNYTNNTFSLTLNMIFKNYLSNLF